MVDLPQAIDIIDRLFDHSLTAHPKQFLKQQIKLVARPDFNLRSRVNDVDFRGSRSAP